MLVSRVQRQIVLQDERCQPQVVRRNRRALFPELAEEGSVLVGRLVVREEHEHTILQEEAPQYPLVLRLATSVGEAGAKLSATPLQRSTYRFVSRATLTARDPHPPGLVRRGRTRGPCRFSTSRRYRSNPSVFAEYRRRRRPPLTPRRPPRSGSCRRRVRAREWRGRRRPGCRGW